MTFRPLLTAVVLAALATAAVAQTADSTAPPSSTLHGKIVEQAEWKVVHGYRVRFDGPRLPAKDDPLEVDRRDASGLHRVSGATWYEYDSRNHTVFVIADEEDPTYGRPMPGDEVVAVHRADAPEQPMVNPLTLP